MGVAPVVVGVALVVVGVAGAVVVVDPAVFPKHEQALRILAVAKAFTYVGNGTGNPAAACTRKVGQKANAAATFASSALNGSSSKHCDGSATGTDEVAVVAPAVFPKQEQALSRLGVANALT